MSVEDLKVAVKTLVLMGVIFGAFIIVSKFFADNPENSPNSFEHKFIVSETLQEDVESFIQEQAPNNISYSYIPAYSHGYSTFGKPQPLVVMLSLRNTDMKKSIEIHKILYYDTKGKLIRQYLKDGLTLTPLLTKEILIDSKDNEGGSGANFIVLFTMDSKAMPPIFETIMSGGGMDRGFAFSSRGIIFHGL